MQPSNLSPEVTAQFSGRLMSYINAQDGHALDAYPFVQVHRGTCWPAVLVPKPRRAGVRFESDLRNPRAPRRAQAHRYRPAVQVAVAAADDLVAPQPSSGRQEHGTFASVRCHLG
jgi:hypothetical protein